LFKGSLFRRTLYNDNNNQDNVYGAVIMTQSQCESSSGSGHELCKTAPDGCRSFDT